MGYESLTAIKQTLSASGLSLGMTIPGWISEPVNDKIEKTDKKSSEDEENEEKNEENSTEDFIL
jgi:hypothetical protein